MRAKKAVVELGGTPLAANSPIVWRLQTGSSPYTAVWEVSQKLWDQELSQKLGEPLTLEITDSRGTKTTIKDVYPLHQVPNSSPNRVSFVVADRRWKWEYTFVAKDYNIKKKSGNVITKKSTGYHPLPEKNVYVPIFDFKQYSLDPMTGGKWTPKRVLQDVLEVVEPRNDGGKSRIESVPIETSSDGMGDFTLQDIVLRDSGDAAIGRVLSYIPGAEVYIDTDGVATVFDGADLDAAEKHFDDLPVPTWEGQAGVVIDRSKIRPEKIVVHYVREIEAVIEYGDDYTSEDLKVQSLGTKEPGDFYCENVIRTVDVQTENVEIFNPMSPEEPEKITNVSPGTYIPMASWLAAMDADKPEESEPWTFETIAKHWAPGTLEGALGVKGNADDHPTANISARLTELKSCFRQVFRINRAYMDRISSLEGVRVGILDETTGDRQPSAVWGQCCSIPSAKGQLITAERKSTDPKKNELWTNLNFLAEFDTGIVSGGVTVGESRLVETTQAPANIEILDADQGIFRINWLMDPYGLRASIIPSMLVAADEDTKPVVPSRNVAEQDFEYLVGVKLETNTVKMAKLQPKMSFKAIVTIMPSAPNNKNRFHREEVQADDINKIFRKEFRLQGGSGPQLDIFIPPSEMTARFAWYEDVDCAYTLKTVMGMHDLKDWDPPGLSLGGLDGYSFINGNAIGGRTVSGKEGRDINSHAISVAAENLAPFADSLQGEVVTKPSKSGLKLVGNMGATGIQVGAYPSAKVTVMHSFPGMQKALNRFALMPHSLRNLILRIVGGSHTTKW